MAWWLEHQVSRPEHGRTLLLIPSRPKFWAVCSGMCIWSCVLVSYSECLAAFWMLTGLHCTWNRIAICVQDWKTAIWACKMQLNFALSASCMLPSLQALLSRGVLQLFLLQGEGRRGDGRSWKRGTDMLGGPVEELRGEHDCRSRIQSKVQHLPQARTTWQEFSGLQWVMEANPNIFFFLGFYLPIKILSQLLFLGMLLWLFIHNVITPESPNEETRITHAGNCIPTDWRQPCPRQLLIQIVLHFLPITFVPFRLGFCLLGSFWTLINCLVTQK